MFWIFLIVALILAANASSPDLSELSSPLVVYTVFALAGLLTGWAFWYTAGWNAHVDAVEDAEVKKARDKANAERR